MPSPFYTLIYDVVPDYVSRRQMYREQHLALAHLARQELGLIAGGAWGQPIDQALLLFQTADLAGLEAFARNDPYVVNGLVLSWRIKPWHVAVPSTPDAWLAQP